MRTIKSVLSAAKSTWIAYWNTPSDVRRSQVANVVKNRRNREV